MANTETYFTLHMNVFPDPSFKINTDEFLTASQDFRTLLDHVGKVFAPATYDMGNNIEKIKKVYENDCDQYKYLEDMILIEKEKQSLLGIDALMWLRRGLAFVLEFFELMCSELAEETNVLILRAYENTLKKHHGWCGRNLFNILSRLVPSRAALIKQLALDREGCEDIVINDLKEYVYNLRLCVNHLTTFYVEHNLESDTKA